MPLKNFIGFLVIIFIFSTNAEAKKIGVCTFSKNVWLEIMQNKRLSV